MNTEIEVKIQISEDQREKLIRWLNEYAQPTGEVHQIEYYLDNPSATFIFPAPEGYKDAKDFLRVRFTNKGDSVCFKHWHTDPKSGKLTHCDEYETSVESGQTMLDLLTAVGFSNNIVIDKIRKTYITSSFEIALDDVSNLGSFVEIEVKTEVSSVAAGIDMIYGLLKDIGVTSFKKMERGYVSMLWNPDKDFGEDVTLDS